MNKLALVLALALPGVAQVDVFLSSEKAVVQVDSSRVAMRKFP